MYVFISVPKYRPLAASVFRNAIFIDVVRLLNTLEQLIYSFIFAEIMNAK